MSDIFGEIRAHLHGAPSSIAGFSRWRETLLFALGRAFDVFGEVVYREQIATYLSDFDIQRPMFTVGEESSLELIHERYPFGLITVDLAGFARQLRGVDSEMFERMDAREIMHEALAVLIEHPLSHRVVAIDAGGRAGGIGDESAALLASRADRFPRLAWLELDHSLELTVNGVEALAEGELLGQLAYLDLEGCLLEARDEEVDRALSVLAASALSEGLRWGYAYQRERRAMKLLHPLDASLPPRTFYAPSASEGWIPVNVTHAGASPWKIKEREGEVWCDLCTKRPGGHVLTLSREVAGALFMDRLVAQVEVSQTLSPPGNRSSGCSVANR